MSLWRLVQIGCVAALALVFATAPAERGEGPNLVAASADGGLSLASSKGGGAIFSAADMGPGEIVSGTVTISNTGEVPGSVTLSDSNLIDTPGPGGGVLSDRLLLLVTDYAAGSPASVRYGGSLRGMPDLPLGVFQPGQRHTYGFLVYFPEGESAYGPSNGDNAFAEAAVRVSYDWTAVAADTPPSGPSVTRDRRAPRVRLRVQGKQLLLSRGYLVVLARCNESCRLNAAGRWQVGARSVRARVRASGTAISTVSAPARQWTRLRIYLPRRERALLRAASSRGRRGSLRLTVTARDPAGNKRRVRSRIGL